MIVCSCNVFSDHPISLNQCVACIAEIRRPTSALGQKATFPCLWRISALLPKADIDC
jgi:hypothetical protein